MSKKLFLLPFLALGLMFASCDKENTDNTGDNNGGNTTGQALNLDLNYNQVQGWLGQPGTAVENQLIQMGFVLMDEDDDEKEGETMWLSYWKFDMASMSGYLCGIALNEDSTVSIVQMIYEASNATCTFGNTVATFKKYVDMQNQTFPLSQSIFNEGLIAYEDSESEEGYAEYEFEAYSEFNTALANLTPNNACSLEWGAYFTDFAIATIGSYSVDEEEGPVMVIGIMAQQMEGNDN